MLLNERDAEGWMVPRRGTKSRLVYGLLKYGLTPMEIAAVIGTSRSSVRVMAYKIRNPVVSKQTRDYWREVHENLIRGIEC